MSLRKPRTYWILRPDQIRAVSSPIRQEIVDRLAALGPAGARELARSLGRMPTSVYHHLTQLVRVGLVKTVRRDGDRGRPGLLYATVAPRMRLARAARLRRNWKPLARAGSSAAKQAGRAYAEGFDARHWAIEGTGRNHWFFRVVATPSRARLKRINALLDRLAELAWTSDRRPGPPITIAWFLAPLASRPAARKVPPKSRSRKAGKRKSP
jgi:predicted ArsR family transcriptional regulator